MTLVNGVDVASYQSLAQVTGAVKSGARFVFVKCTEATGYVNPSYSQQVAAARAGGALVGHYHFAHPAADPVAEAKYFLASASIKPGDAIALDLEYASDGASWARRAAYASAWLMYVNAVTHARPVLYVNKSWLAGVLGAAQLAQRQIIAAAPLWIATAGLPAGQPGIAQPWALHQYSTAGGIDHDVLAVPWDSFAVPAPTPTGGTTTTTTGGSMTGADATYLWGYYTHNGKNVAQVIFDTADAVAALGSVPAPAPVQPAPVSGPVSLSDADKDDIAQRVANLLAARLQS